MTKEEKLAYLQTEIRRVAREDLGIELDDDIDRETIDRKTFYALVEAMQKRGILMRPN